MKKKSRNELIGEAIVSLLDLRGNKFGRFGTSWGSKTLEGLGASVIANIEDVDNAMMKQAELAENDENHLKFGIITKQEHEDRIREINKQYP